jgi:hypothetical protein
VSYLLFFHFIKILIERISKASWCWILWLLNDVGIFPSICVGKIGPLCNLCAESKESHPTLTIGSSIISRYVFFFNGYQLQLLIPALSDF